MLRLYQYILILAFAPFSFGFGGEKAFFNTTPGTYDVSHRQNVCDHFEDFYFHRVELRNALDGLQLNVGLGFYPDGFFNYDPETGIDQREPGIIPVVLDEMARRGGFSWRNSFGIYTNPKPYNITWNETLHWSMETYDVVADWWTDTRERWNQGVAFVEPFLDSSFVLVTREALQQKTSSELTVSSFFNWLKPYDSAVWGMTLFTIFLSGIVYQILEWYADERDDRSAWEWWLENAYLSFINATQAYEYQPKTLASRIFGISMAIWALVMTATYTANLASLLVDRKIAGPQSLEEIAVFGHKICTWQGTATDDFVRSTYKKAPRVEKTTEQGVYQGLVNGDCEFMLTNLNSFQKYSGMEDFNPKCDMYLVDDGRKVVEMGAGFVTTAKSGGLCTGLVRDVFNLLMRDLIEDGFLERAWEHEYTRTQTIDCLNYKPGMDAASSGENSNADGDDVFARTRHLLQGHPQPIQSTPPASQRRSLKGTGATAGAVASMEPSDDDTKMTLEQMIGTFACHWGLMIIAVITAHISTVYNKHGKPRAKKASKAIAKSIGKMGGTATVTSPDQESEEEAQSFGSENFKDEHDESKDGYNKCIMIMEKAQQAQKDREERMQDEMASMRSELGDLRNQIKELLDTTLAPDAYWGASMGAHYRLQDDDMGMEGSHVSTSSIMRGQAPIPSSNRRWR